MHDENERLHSVLVRLLRVLLVVMEHQLLGLTLRLSHCHLTLFRCAKFSKSRWYSKAL